MVWRRATIGTELPSRRLASTGWAWRRLLGSSACRTRPRRTLMSSGLAMKSNAPALRATTAASTLPVAVIMAIGVLGQRVEVALIRGRQETAGRRMLVRLRSEGAG